MPEPYRLFLRIEAGNILSGKRQFKVVEALESDRPGVESHFCLMLSCDILGQFSESIILILLTCKVPSLCSQHTDRTEESYYSSPPINFFTQNYLSLSLPGKPTR